MANYVAQIVDLALKKCAFLYLRTQQVSVEAGQDGTEVVQVLLEGTTMHKDVIKVYNYILIEHIKEYLVHQPLEG